MFPHTNVNVFVSQVPLTPVTATLAFATVVTEPTAPVPTTPVTEILFFVITLWFLTRSFV